MKQLGFGLELRLHGPQLNLEDWHLGQLVGKERKAA